MKRIIAASAVVVATFGVIAVGVSVAGPASSAPPAKSTLKLLTNTYSASVVGTMGQDAIASVSCQLANEVAVGGGHQNDNTNVGGTLVWSKPLLTNGVATGWSVNLGSMGASATVYVICAQVG